MWSPIRLGTTKTLKAVRIISSISRHLSRAQLQGLAVTLFVGVLTFALVDGQERVVFFTSPAVVNSVLAQPGLCERQCTALVESWLAACLLRLRS